MAGPLTGLLVRGLYFKVIDRSEGKVEIGSWVPTVEDVRARQMPPTMLFIQVPRGQDREEPASPRGQSDRRQHRG